MRKMLVVCGLVAVLLCWSVNAVHAFIPNVDKAGNGDKNGTKVTGVTGERGKVIHDVKNTSGKAANDVHVKITSMMHDPDGPPVPYGAEEAYKVAGITTVEIDDDTSHMTGEANEDGEGADAECAEGESLANNKKLKISILIEKNGVAVEGIKVEMEIRWTEEGQTISATDTKTIGDGRPRTPLSAEIIPNYNPQAVEVDLGADEVTLNDICLAETDGYRFQDNGDIVLKAPNSTAFNITLNTQILIYDEDGDAADPTQAGAANLRIDERGNFVFNVSRDALAEKHVVLVIRNLKLEGLDDYQYDPGHALHADLSGSAISGHCIHDVYHLATMGEEG